MLLLLQQNLLLGDDPSLVNVPDVVGQTQAAGTATLTGDGFVVAVVTANSSSVPAGTIIGQSPTAGSSELLGSTVTITVSLGDGGGGWWPDWHHARGQRDKKKREQEEREAEAKLIQDELDRNIYLAQRKLEAEEAERTDLARLQALADTYAGQRLDGLPKSARVAILNAQDARTRNSLEQMRRVIEQSEDEEMFALQVALLLVN